MATPEQNQSQKFNRLTPEDENASTKSLNNGMDRGFINREDRRSTKDVFMGFNLNRIAAEKTEQDKCIEKCLVFLSVVLLVITFPISLFTVFVALTKDALTVTVDAVVYYKISNPVWAVVNVADYKSATQYLAATILRNALGSRKLNEILVDRPAVSYQMFDSMKNLTRDWGVHIVRVEVKDISLPIQLQRAMATEAESSRLANAKIIVARAEIEATKNLQIATKMLMDNPYCMQLRYLQSLQMISGDKTHTVVIPFSAETIKKIFK